MHEFKRDLILNPRRFWQSTKSRKSSSTLGAVGDWHRYLTTLLGTQESVSVSRHGSAVQLLIPLSNDLDRLFTQGEVADAIKSVKMGKAADVFGLTAEVIKDFVLPSDDDSSEPGFVLVPPPYSCFQPCNACWGRAPLLMCRLCAPYPQSPDSSELRRFSLYHGRLPPGQTFLSASGPPPQLLLGRQ